MRTRRRFVRGAVTGVVGLAGVSAVTGDETAECGTDTTEYVVLGTETAKDDIQAGGFTVKAEITDDVYTVTGPESRHEMAGINGISAVVPNFAVEAATPSAVGEGVSEPTYVDSQWDNEVTEATAAHEYATGEGARIAIVDTGVDHTHPDLGNVNAERSVSIVDGDVSDYSGFPGFHGTHVAGVAGATGAEGVVGMAPDAELVSIDIFGPGGGTFEGVLQAIEYATVIDADVVNLSLGSNPLPPGENRGGIRGLFNSVCRTATRAGTLVTASVGNEGVNLQGGGFRLPSSSAGVLAVSGTGPDDELAYYSNYGTGDVDVAAPGGGRATAGETTFTDGVLSTVPTGWTWISGTSMAAAQVAGLAALVRELDPNANVQQVSNAIERDTEGVRGRGNPYFGAGRINALETVEGF